MDRSTSQRAITAALLTLAREIEVADRNTFNLKKAYNDWNRKLFDGNLPKIKLRWSRSKRNAGLTKGKRLAGGAGWEVTEVSVSDFHESTAVEIDAILVHEMIHVKLFLAGIEEAHGKAFMDERRRVNVLTPFEVPLTEDVTNKKVSRVAPIKPIGVLYLPANKGAIFFNANALPKAMQDYDGFPNGWKKAVGTLEFYVVAERELAKYPLKRKVTRGKFSYYPMEDDIIDLILAGKKVGEVVAAEEVAAMSRGVAELVVEAALIVAAPTVKLTGKLDPYQKIVFGAFVGHMLAGQTMKITLRARKNLGKKFGYVRANDLERGIYDVYFEAGDTYLPVSMGAIAHELTHVLQYLRGDLSFDGETFVWKGSPIIGNAAYNKLDYATYAKLPWEVEAIKAQKTLPRAFLRAELGSLKGKDPTLDYLIENDSF